MVNANLLADLKCLVAGLQESLTPGEREQFDAIIAALESEEVMVEGVVELERGNCCRTRADEEGWGHIRVYIGAHWPAPKDSRRVRIVAVKEGEQGDVASQMP